MLKITEKTLPELGEKIHRHLRASGGIFGDSNITSTNNIHASISDAIVPMLEYCKKHGINVTQLDSIKLLVFALPFIQGRDPTMNTERYILSIFLLLQESYGKKIDFDTQINHSIKVCDSLFRHGDILVVYGYVKGFQESLEYT